jgi:hypothetical protein
MSFDADHRKSFPDEAGYNVGAGFGILAGVAVGLFASLDVMPLPGFGNHLGDWPLNVSMAAIGGGLLGAIADQS